MNSPRDRNQRIENHPALRCWFCEAPSILKTAIEGGIIVSRSPDSGGPYYLYTCPYCLNDSMCEETRAGRWFASPTARLGFLDYLLAHVGESDDNSESVLKTISWYRENEDRRRYFFERDGDHRYSNNSILARLWPWARSEEVGGETTARGASARQAETDGSRVDRSGADDRDGREKARREERQQSKPRGPRILSPHEILGVPPEASREEIERRFYRLAVQYHPDKVHHRGGEFRAEAHRRFVQLQRAYRELIKRQA